MRRSVGWVLAIASTLAFSFGGAGAQVDSCTGIVRPSSPMAPSMPPDSTRRGADYWRWSHAFERETTGVGVLSPLPRQDGSPPGFDWLPEVSLPLFARAGNPVPSGWMHLGWWVSGGPGDSPRALTYRGMLETEYEQASLVVTEARGDGWLQVWVDIGPIGRAASHGLMWTHACLLDLGSTSLGLSLWEERFVGPGAPPLSFLGEERHALRASPGAGATLVAWLDDEVEVELIEIDGDWARVRATSPGVFLHGCIDGGEWDGDVLEGWVRWRDATSGTWVWYPTRGC